MYNYVYIQLCLMYLDRDDCTPNPCQHDGTCTDALDDYICNCADGFNGKNCEISKSPLSTKNK